MRDGAGGSPPHHLNPGGPETPALGGMTGG